MNIPEVLELINHKPITMYHNQSEKQSGEEIAEDFIRRRMNATGETYREAASHVLAYLQQRFKLD